MGLFTKLQNFVTEKVSASTREKVVGGINKALAVLTDPIKSIGTIGKQGAFTQLAKAQDKKSTIKLVAEGVENTLIAVAPFTSGIKTAVTKAVVSSSLKTKALGAVLIGAVASSPTIRKTAIEVATPSNLISTGEKIGQFVEKAPEAQKDFFSDAVVLGATGLGLGAVVAGGTALLVNDIKDGGLIDSNNKLPRENYIEIPEQKTLPVATQGTNAPDLPTGSPTQTLTKSNGKKRKRRAKQQQNLKVSQNVRVVVNQKNLNSSRSTRVYGITR